MGGGLLQLVAYGAQDVYLTGNPQITFFMVVYRRHTNFAIEAIEQTLNGTAGYGNTVYVTVSRNGDLINKTYLQLNAPILTGGDRYVNYYGLRLLNSVTVEIGGQQIDKHYSDWLYIWNELSLPSGKKYAYEKMVGADGDILTDEGATLYVPLEFWFCRNVGLSLPLIALQYHEVKFKIVFEQLENCIYRTDSASLETVSSALSTANVKLWVDYIFLDTDERRRFAQNSTEYLIEQLQFTGGESLSKSSGNRYRLNFNHPCKELVWVGKRTDTSTYVNHWYNYTSNITNNSYESPDYESRIPLLGGIYSCNLSAFTSNLFSGVYPTGPNPFTKCLLQLNGNDRFAERNGTYFSSVQPYQHHTNIPKNKGINIYSFALKPEEHQPSGTLNMSRIDTAMLSLNSDMPGVVNIYAVNYNVLRIMSGMGGLAYSN
jgi:hypothetical protein